MVFPGRKGVDRQVFSPLSGTKKGVSRKNIYHNMLYSLHATTTLYSGDGQRLSRPPRRFFNPFSTPARGFRPLRTLIAISSRIARIFASFSSRVPSIFDGSRNGQ